MKRIQLVPLISILSALAAFGLRLWQNRTGFEIGTRLPIPGNPAGLLLIVLLIGTALLLAVCTLMLKPQEEPLDFPAAFSTDSPALLMLPVAGILLMGLSGVLDVASGLGLYQRFATVLSADGAFLSPMVVAEEQFSFPIHLLLGVSSLLCACCLFPVVAACRRKENAVVKPNSTLLLAPPTALVVRLVLTYRVDSVNPVFMAYYVELLALVLLTLGFYRLASFAYQAGHTGRFSLYAAGALPLCMAAVADNSHPAASLLYLGGGLTLLGFLLLRAKQP